MDESVQDLRKKLQETLERNRAFVAGMAFGVPAEATLEYTDAIVDDLVKAITEWADEPLSGTEATPLSLSDSTMELISPEDEDLEYAKIYGVYPDGRPYSSENVNWKQVIDPSGTFDAFANDHDTSDTVDQQHP